MYNHERQLSIWQAYDGTTLPTYSRKQEAASKHPTRTAAAAVRPQQSLQKSPGRVQFNYHQPSVKSRCCSSFNNNHTSSNVWKSYGCDICCNRRDDAWLPVRETRHFVCGTRTGVMLKELSFTRWAMYSSGGWSR